MQSRLYRWFTKTNATRWINIIDDIVYSYNNSPHSSTLIAPVNVTSKNEEDVWQTLYSHLSSPNPTSLLKVGDTVRISRFKHVFSKGYDTNWSIEEYIIDKVLPTDPTTYRLKDQMGEKIHGSYYVKESQRVAPSQTYAVEKILDERKVGRKTEYFVKFKGYPAKFNAWIPKSNILLL